MKARIFRFRRGEWLLGERPHLLGIINVTPDSFSDGSPAWQSPGYHLSRAQQLLVDGADGLDLGAESTRPGHTPISVGEEWMRLEPVLRIVRAEYPDVPISVDTSKVEVAKWALDSGADIINDIWGLSREAGLAQVTGRAGAGYIGMFNEEVDPQQPLHLDDIRNFFQRMMQTAQEAGLAPQTVLVDPGIGFRVQGDHIWQVLTHLSHFQGLGAGILVGHSRKRFLGAVTGLEKAQDRDTATGILSCLLALHGADVLRVHDVATTRQAILIARQWSEAFGTN